MPKRCPIIFQFVADNFIDLLLICIDGKNSIRILCASKSSTCTTLRSKGVRCLQEVILERLSEVMNQLMCLSVSIVNTILSKVVRQTNETNTQ